MIQKVAFGYIRLSIYLTIVLQLLSFDAHSDLGEVSCGKLFITSPRISTHSEPSFWGQLRTKIKEIFTSSFDQRLSAIQPVQLSTETGTQPLTVIRINMSGVPNDALILRDFARVLAYLPHLRLVIVTRSMDRTNQLIHKLIPDDQLSQISIINSLTLSLSPIDIWAQDNSKPLKSSRLATLIRQRPKSDEGKAELHTATLALGKNNFIDVVKTSLPFEGGNIVVGDKHIFIGSDSITFLMDKWNITREQAQRVFSTQFSQPVVEIGIAMDDSFYQPSFHIDLIMAVIQDRVHDRDSNLVVLNSPMLLFELSKADPLLRKILSKIEVDIRLQQKEMDKISELLEKLGYRVVFIPGYFNDDPESSPLNTAEYNITQISYTNAVFSDGIVLVPQYNNPIDEAAYNIYRELGYTIIPMSSSRNTIIDFGAIRCVTETYRDGC